MVRRRALRVAFLVTLAFYVFLNFLNLAHLGRVFSQVTIGLLSLIMGAVVLALVPIIGLFRRVLKEPVAQKRLKILKEQSVAIKLTLSFTALITSSCLLIWLILPSLPVSITQMLIGGTVLGFVGGLICTMVINFLDSVLPCR